MPKINGTIVCPECASKNVKDIGHGGYAHGQNGFGDKRTMIAYQCQESSCKHAWNE